MDEQEDRISGDAQTMVAPPAKSQRPTISQALASRTDTVGDLGDRLVETSFDERYAARELLGVGGMGEVRLMVDQRVGRGVAMKVLGQGIGSDASRVRFIWEARVQAQLEHPAIVPIYDMGLTSDGTEYFTMKRISGLTLAEVLDRLHDGDVDAIDEYPRAKLLGIFRQVCLAIEYAHRRGVIHRDIKPANIMLGALGEVYVLDWGLAKIGSMAEVEGAASSGPRGQSVDGSILGTPGYMAPEQAAGRRDVDERADVYALGAVLYEILTHAHLHEGSRPVDLLRATMEGVDIEARDLDAPPELVALCMEATRRAPEDRLASARALAEGIELYLDGDRDLAARTALARRHIEEAHAARARGEGEEERRTAMRAAGRALALDPTATEAADLVSRLLLEPPVEAPAEVERQLDAIDLATGRQQGRMGVVAMSGYLWFVPLLWWSGIREPTVVIAFTLVSLLAVAQVYWMTRQQKVPLAAIYLSAVISALLFALISRLVGPFIIVPTLVLTQLMAYAVHPRFGHVGIIATIITAGIAVPWLLEIAGVIEPTYRFENGALILESPSIAFTRAPVELAFAVLLVSNSAITAVLLRSMASKQRAVTKQIELQSWQLRQIVHAPR